MLHRDRHLVIMPNEGEENVLSHTVLLHNAEELDNDLGARSDENLTLSGLLSVVDAVERIVED